MRCVIYPVVVGAAAMTASACLSDYLILGSLTRQYVDNTHSALRCVFVYLFAGVVLSSCVRYVVNNVVTWPFLLAGPLIAVMDCVARAHLVHSGSVVSVNAATRVFAYYPAAWCVVHVAIVATALRYVMRWKE